MILVIDKYSGEPLLLNMDSILYMRPTDDGTVVHLVNGERITVEMELDELINSASEDDGKVMH